MAHLNAETGVRWCQSKSIQTTTPDSSHQRLKLTGRATPATLLASPPPPSTFLVVDILSEEFERA
jgi:hypothetical protein